MIVVMRTDATKEQLEGVISFIQESGLRASVTYGAERNIVGVVGAITPDLVGAAERLAGVSDVLRVSRPFKLSSREFHPDDTVITVNGITIGGGAEPVVMAGPCSVESEKQVVETARAVKAAGARILRGGAFKPRSSPYSFRGLGVQGLKFLETARRETGLPIITEVMAIEDIDGVYKHSDILQIGARNMQNFNLLDEVGKVDKPVMLKRGLAATIEEWLLAAEYILAQGNKQLALCERGIRTFETYTRNTLDLSAIPLIHKLSHLPIIADPSHGTGKWYLVPAMAAAAVAAGADGIMVEVHPSPDHAKSDGPQSLTPENFAILMDQVRAIRKAMPGRIRPLSAVAGR